MNTGWPQHELPERIEGIKCDWIHKDGVDCGVNGDARVKMVVRKEEIQ